MPNAAMTLGRESRIVDRRDEFPFFRLPIWVRYMIYAYALDLHAVARLLSRAWEEKKEEDTSETCSDTGKKSGRGVRTLLFVPDLPKMTTPSVLLVCKRMTEETLQVLPQLRLVLHHGTKHGALSSIQRYISNKVLQRIRHVRLDFTLDTDSPTAEMAFLSFLRMAIVILSYRDFTSVTLRVTEVGHRRPFQCTEPVISEIYSVIEYCLFCQRGLRHVVIGDWFAEMVKTHLTRILTRGHLSFTHCDVGTASESGMFCDINDLMTIMRKPRPL